MAWELGRGPNRAARVLRLARRQCRAPPGLALRWLAEAPAVDATWEYYASKQPARSLSGLQIGGVQFDLQEVRAIASWDPMRRRVGVKLWHPEFARVPESIRIQVGFLFFDNLLGEDGVERWVGQIDLLDAPVGGRTPAELKDEIDRRSAESAGDDRWVLVEEDATRRGGRDHRCRRLAETHRPSLRRPARDRPDAGQRRAMAAERRGSGDPGDRGGGSRTSPRRARHLRRADDRTRVSARSISWPRRPTG